MPDHLVSCVSATKELGVDGLERVRNGEEGVTKSGASGGGLSEM